ncbi:hypothetical protein BD779DRAFT_1680756 [Infundibulicybe gibba]|nr:hypothetical protein BD779DRAFT_1680756 [Infundibulicybe gibba]
MLVFIRIHIDLGPAHSRPPSVSPPPRFAQRRISAFAATTYSKDDRRAAGEPSGTQDVVQGRGKRHATRIRQRGQGGRKEGNHADEEERGFVLRVREEERGYWRNGNRRSCGGALWAMHPGDGSGGGISFMFCRMIP